MLRTLSAGLLALASAGLVLAANDAHAASSPDSTPDGLEKVSVEGVDASYRRPGATFGEYNKIKIGSITVAFNKNWEKTPLPGTRFKMRSEDAQKIKDRVAGLLREEIASALKAGGYEVVETSGEDVLEFAAAIVELYINKPQVHSAARADTYAVSAGEMTIVAELRDSLSGEVLSRAYDRGAARETQTPHFIAGSENEKEARKIIQGWATLLVQQLDATRKG
jgi:hypothetical protein